MVCIQHTHAHYRLFCHVWKYIVAKLGDSMVCLCLKNDKKLIQQSYSCVCCEEHYLEQGKSEGFDSCDRPSYLTQIGLKSSSFQDVWPWNLMDDPKQGKSEGFESCDRPIVRKRPIWVKIGDVLSRVTLKFDGWPWKTIGHLPFAVSSLVQPFIAIGEFKLELQSGNAQFGSNSKNFRAVWPWNLAVDLETQ